MRSTIAWRFVPLFASTKIARSRRKKGNDWHFGMKAHMSVDAASGLVHTAIGKADNLFDVMQAPAPLHGGEIAEPGDAGYQGG